MRRFILAISLTVALCLSIGVGTAYAEKPDNPNCWGKATTEFSKSGTMGAHASDPEGDGVGNTGKRLGLRNFARELLGPDATLQDLGAAVSDCEISSS